jgi:hypothetical protein
MCLLLKIWMMWPWRLGLTNAIRIAHAVGYLHAKYLCKVFDLASPGAPLLLADPEKASRTVLKKLARRGLLQQLDLPFDTLNSANNADPTWKLARTAHCLQIGQVSDRAAHNLSHCPTVIVEYSWVTCRKFISNAVLNLDLRVHFDAPGSEHSRMRNY